MQIWCDYSHYFAYLYRPRQSCQIESPTLLIERTMYDVSLALTVRPDSRRRHLLEGMCELWYRMVVTTLTGRLLGTERSRDKKQLN